MFIPPNKSVNKAASTDISGVQLQASHLLISREIAEPAFGTEKNVYLVYYASQRSILIAPVSDEVFKKMHKASQHMLKNKNLKGDKSIALHGLLIDEEIDATDRALVYDFQPELGILKVLI